MTPKRNSLTARRDSVDLLVVGGGVFGLQIALKAARAGMTVRLIEAGRIGAGASGGLLGALTAHIPTPWNAKKQFQLDALQALPAEVEALRAETGIDVGYRRSGRVMPISNAAFRAQIPARAAAAAERWGGAVYEARDRAGRDPGAAEEGATADWLDPAAAAHGYVWDSLAAKLAPRAYLAALRDAAERAGAEIEEGVAYRDWRGGARLSSGETAVAGAVALAQGAAAFAAARDLGPVDGAAGPSPVDPGSASAGGDASDALDLGGGVLGQSALLAAPGCADRPILYEDGVYVVPQGDAHVAVGSTSEVTTALTATPDPSDDGFLRRARALCPAIRSAPVVEWWAGVRPKAWARDPIVGRLPVAAPVWIAGGGFKIGFGVAHRIAEALVGALLDAPAPQAPETFTVAHHLRAAARRAGSRR